MRVPVPGFRFLRLALALVAIGPSATAAAATQRVGVRTDDGLTLAATWYEPSSRPAPAVILVHMLHRSRLDWEGLATRLAAEGIGALAIDLRGHGESPGAVAEGDSPEYSAMIRDVIAARHYLASRPDVQQSHVGIAGASFGASLAAIEAGADPTVASLALLSPAMDYRGLRMDAAMKKYGARPALLVSSDDDPYATRSVRELQKGAPGPRQPVLLSHAGHGTVMLSRDADLTRTLVDWFHRTLL